MTRILKSFGGTVGLVVGLILLLLIVKGLSMIPIISLWGFVKNYWPGIFAGVVISYIGVGVNEFIESKRMKKKARNKK